MILSIADTFIKKPILTTVCTIVIVLLGGVCLPLLPIEYIPQIAPIQVQISASYVGADPQTIETTVTTPIERKLNGTRDMQYFSSNECHRRKQYLGILWSRYEPKHKPGKHTE